MRMIRRSFMVMVLLAFAASAALAQESAFKAYNPDIDKTAFVRDFIYSLGYYKAVYERLKTEEGAGDQALTDMKWIRLSLENRTRDNTDIRIARNYLTRYASSRNGVVREVTKKATAAYDAILAMSVRERDLWQALGKFRTSGKPADFDEKGVGEKLVGIARDKKEAAKELLAAAVQLRIVMLSHDRCISDDCHNLYFSGAERLKLVGYLDPVAGNNLQWGVKEGQSTFDATVAVIREVLEDPFYKSSDQ